jgi:hypothetical protein
MRELLLPIEAKFGVYTAYVYYKKLLKKLENPYHQIEMKVRVSNYTKRHYWHNLSCCIS